MDPVSYRRTYEYGTSRDVVPELSYFLKLRPIPCTACRGCMPCPQDIDVPRIFELYNDAIMYGDIGAERSIYSLEQHGIASCTECGACVNACGRKIAILDWLKTAHQLLAE
jgi:predicted aldo/keto reductase-like oxidoreductase